MTPIQERLLEMISWFHDFCKKNDIRYYAVGGTVLGAMRHKGFIPWDDDIDIAIPRSDYNKLINLFTESIDGYVLESPYSGNHDFLYTYSKLYDTSTTLIEKARNKCKRGIYIDIFPLDGIGMTYEEALSNFAKVDKLNMFLMTRTCCIRNDRSIVKNMAIIFSRLIPSFVVNNKEISIKIDQISYGLDKEGSLYLANTMGAYRSKEIIESDVFGTPQLQKFESIELYCPEKPNEYLCKLYGDWTKLPPEDKRYTKHDYYEMNLNKSYLSVN